MACDFNPSPLDRYSMTHEGVRSRSTESPLPAHVRQPIKMLLLQWSVENTEMRFQIAGTVVKENLPSHGSWARALPLNSLPKRTLFGGTDGPEPSL